MKNRNAGLLLICALGSQATSAISAASSEDWIPARQRDGISVYIREVPGTKIIKVKTHVIIDAPLQRIQHILDDAEHRKHWVPYLQDSTVLEQMSADERIEYSLFAAPWPASDRDFVYRMTRLQDSPDKLVYAMKSEITELMPQQQSIVRAELIESQYSLTALGPQQTQVDLVFHADPKGWLPTWIINIIQKVLPYMMLKNIRQQAQSASD